MNDGNLAVLAHRSREAPHYGGKLALIWQKAPVLRAVQSAINTAGSNQIVVTALLGDTAFIDDHNPVGILDGGEAMGDDECGPALGKLGQRLLNKLLGLRVQG